MSSSQVFFCPCPRGLEGVLASELTALGADQVHSRDSGVAFCGDFLLAMRINLESRIASRLLWQVATGTYDSEQTLYERAAELPWSEWFTVDDTLKIDTRAHHSPVRSLDFVTLRIKDAICDHFRARTGQRPSIDTQQPGVRVHLFLDENQFTLSLDTSGDALFKRGERAASGDAPLKKNLAAGLLALAEWRPGIPLLDAFCGSGTILLEAAEQSLQRAPGLHRSFAFERLLNWPVALHWPKVQREALNRALPPAPLPLWGRDLKGDSLEQTRLNFEAAGLSECVTLKQVNMLESLPRLPPASC